MHSYSLGVAASWFFIIALVLSAIAFAAWSYFRTVPPISPARRITLTILRSLAVSLLLFALFEPVLTFVSTTSDAPEAGILLDNSQSMTIDAGGHNRREEFREALQKTIKVAPFAWIAAKFDDRTSAISSLDSVNFTGGSTDMGKSLEWLRKESGEKNIRAALMITDGAFNTGNNPIYAAEELGFPVYIVGIGDSTEPKDISVQSLITNEFGSLDAELPVNVSVKSIGYDGEEAKVILADNGTPISEQTIKLRSSQQSYPLVFAYKPAAEGIRKLTASIVPLHNELTAKNNSASAYIRISKQKRSIFLFAGAPSPDITFFHAAVTEEKNTNLQLFVQKQGAEFYAPPPTSQQLAEAELIVFIGFPIASTSQAVLNEIKKELDHGKPFLFIASQQTDYSKLKQFEAFLPFTILSSRQQEYLAFVDVKQQSLGNVLMKINGTEADNDIWNQLPPIYRTETFVKMKPEAEMLASVKVNSMPIAEPMICARDFQQSKSVAILGYGLYRWKLMGFAADQAKGRAMPDVFSTFIGNALRWLQADENRKQVRIKTTKKFYGANEVVEFTAEVYDRSLSPIDNAEVRIAIIGGKQQKREVLLQSYSNGRYAAQVEGISEGDYSFNGAAFLNKALLGAENGRFSVGGDGLEYQNTRMNVELLRTIAARTGGKFYTPETAGEFLNDLKHNPLFVEQVITRRSELALWNMPWMLGASLLCFALEWFLRKRAGMV